MGDDSIGTPEGRPARFQPVARTAQSPTPGSYDWLRSRHEGRPALAGSSVKLLDELYDEPDS